MKTKGIRAEITRLDGSVSVVPITPGVQVAFERHFKTGIGSGIERAEYFYWMAWEAERRDLVARGEVTKLFDDWLLDVADVSDPDPEDSGNTGAKS